MRNRFVIGSALVASLVLGTTAGAAAGPATEQLKSEIARVIATIENPSLQPESRTAERRQAIRTITDGIFDWPEMARQALGRHWEERTAAEQAEFVALFRDLLERAYIGKIERYGAENVAYVGEATDDDAAMVRTRVTLRPGQEVMVDYRMARQGARWMIHDVVIESVSLVANYRTQFEGVIKTSSYRDLIKKIRTRLS
ncbi:MAG TPA: ABC transporter substrate-binding protein [Methylomirabilota bacterium]|nr:ABC transporter substrate-binding protein [Methylomirabilota bacterium]